MNRNLALLIMLFFSPVSLACGDFDCVKGDPVLLYFPEPVSFQDFDIKQGSVEAVIDLSEIGEVTSVSILSYSPQGLLEPNLRKSLMASKFDPATGDKCQKTSVIGHSIRIEFNL